MTMSRVEIFAALGAVGLAGVVAPVVASGLRTAGYGPQTLLERLQRKKDGLRCVYTDEEPDVDIVCVHGLGGDAVGTWTKQSYPQPVNWTTDLLPEVLGKRSDPDSIIKGIRVLSYGYSPTLFMGSQTRTESRDARILQYMPEALDLHARRLIIELADVRQREGQAAERRPLIFIAHSLGGMIVKSALVHASEAVEDEDRRLKAIELLTIGALFFGCPQRELYSSRWTKVMKRFLHSNPLTVPLGRVEPLDKQADIFNWQIEQYKSIETRFPNFSFYEGTPSLVEEGFEKSIIVVQWKDATPQEVKDSTWKQIRLQCTHKDLVKFDSREDPDFHKVSQCLSDCLKINNYRRALIRRGLFNKFQKSPRSHSKDLNKAEKMVVDLRPKYHDMFIQIDSEFPKDNKTNYNKKKQILFRSEQSHGLTHLLTLSLVDDVGHAALETKRYDEAETLFKRLLIAYEDIYAPCSEEVAGALMAVAQATSHLGRMFDATKLCFRARDILFDLGRKINDPAFFNATVAIIQLFASMSEYVDALKEINNATTHLKDEADKAGAEKKLSRLQLLETEILGQGRGNSDSDVDDVMLSDDEDEALLFLHQDTIATSPLNRDNHSLPSPPSIKAIAEEDIENVVIPK